jgi:hypothetical protein
LAHLVHVVAQVSNASATIFGSFLAYGELADDTAVASITSGSAFALLGPLGEELFLRCNRFRIDFLWATADRYATPCRCTGFWGATSKDIARDSSRLLDHRVDDRAATAHDAGAAEAVDDQCLCGPAYGTASPVQP